MNSLLETSIKDIIKNYSSFFLNKKNVLGVGLGYKTIKNLETNELSIHILVNKKVPLNNLYKKDVISKTFLGLKTDIIEIGLLQDNSITEISSKEKKTSTHTSRIRPLKAGYSIGTAMSGITGTLGAIVFDDVNTPYILSNNHILAGENKNKKGTLILQPGASDGGFVKNNIVGKLYDFVSLSFEENSNKDIATTNIADCAIAKIDSNIDYNSNFKIFGKIRGVSKPVLRSEVFKIGRTTGYTNGFIKTINATLRYKSSYNGLYKTFSDLIITTNMSYKGDSGSLLVNSENKALGLLVGDNPLNSWFNPIEYILNVFNVHF
ncbi:hypothetical protein [Clostridium tarantellae]|uniref:Serine protease n=1 Tax=Clostridium tarantellae TaxID=39493 RepID=A0A6I1MI52_9CLOT|nr:hypothetical protein [Clostridium tarantellae]MPQ43236.1 hypothetical protein [Clostridium tarantellae]